MDLAGNVAGPDGGAALGLALRKNAALTAFDLSDNQLVRSGAWAGKRGVWEGRGGVWEGGEREGVEGRGRGQEARRGCVGSARV